MIIEVTGPAGSAATQEAADRLAALAADWDVSVTVTRAAPQVSDRDRVVDPVSITALVLSIPSAVLAVMDLADRIAKRRRAKQLIHQANTIRATTGVQVTVVLGDGRRRPLHEVDPDDLLETAAPAD